MLAFDSLRLGSAKRSPYTRKKFTGSLTQTEEILHQFHLLSEKLEKLSEAIDSLALEQRMLLERQVEAGIDVPLKFSKEALAPACYCHKVKKELVDIIQVGGSRLDKDKILERLHDLVNPKFESQGFNSTGSYQKKAKTDTSDEDKFHGIHTPSNLQSSVIKESPFRIQNRFRSYSRELPKLEKHVLLNKGSPFKPQVTHQKTYQGLAKRFGFKGTAEPSEEVAEEWEPGGLHLPDRFSTAANAASKKSRSNLQLGSTIAKLLTFHSGQEATDSGMKKIQLTLAPTTFDNHIASSLSNLAVSGNLPSDNLRMPFHNHPPLDRLPKSQLTIEEVEPEPEPLEHRDRPAAVLNTSTDSQLF